MTARSDLLTERSEIGGGLLSWEERAGSDSANAPLMADRQANLQEEALIKQIAAMDRKPSLSAWQYGLVVLFVLGVSIIGLSLFSVLDQSSGVSAPSDLVAVPVECNASVPAKGHCWVLSAAGEACDKICGTGSHVDAEATVDGSGDAAVEQALSDYYALGIAPPAKSLSGCGHKALNCERTAHHARAELCNIRC